MEIGRVIYSRTVLPNKIYQSKLLCLSLLYLLSSIFFAIYHLTSFERRFRSSSSPIQDQLFFYPSSYGEHKHAVPTTRSTCNYPVYFSDYELAVKEMLKLCDNDSTALGIVKPSPNLAYMKGNHESFGGNLSLEKRLTYFDLSERETAIPCGFFKPFPVSDSDRVAMESCRGLVVVSAIFNDHDKIRQPKGVGSKTLEIACFFMFVDDVTLDRFHVQNLISSLPRDNDNHNKIGAWRIVKVSSDHRLYENAAMNGEIPKYLIHRLFPNSKYSIWVDAKLQLVIDPILLVHSLVVKEGVDMAISRHPYFLHTMEETVATARWRKWWDVDGLKNQMETYCDNGLTPWSSKKPYPSDVPDSAIILRRHSLASNLFSCLVFNELEAFNPRDQLPFAYVRDKMNPKLKLNMFQVEVFEKIAVEYRHNLVNNKPAGQKVKVAASSDFFVKGNTFNNSNISISKCEDYLLKMWGGR